MSVLALLKEKPLVAVHDDPAVKTASEGVAKARAAVEHADSEERRLIRIVTGVEPSYTDDQLDEAHRRLAIHKGTQSGWFLPEREEAASRLKQAQAVHRAAVDPAKQRLLAAGEARLITLVKELDAALGPARSLAADLDALLKELSDGGVRPPSHPCSALLPDGTVDFQLRLARERGWI